MLSEIGQWLLWFSYFRHSIENQITSLILLRKIQLTGYMQVARSPANITNYDAAISRLCSSPVFDNLLLWSMQWVNETLTTLALFVFKKSYIHHSSEDGQFNQNDTQQDQFVCSNPAI